MQNSFHMKGFALRLVLKQRHKRTRKWPILQSWTKALGQIGPLHDSVTWDKNASCTVVLSKQNKTTRTSPPWPYFALEVPCDPTVQRACLHFWRFCTYARHEYNFTCLRHPPHPHPYTMLKTTTCNFFWFSTLYWVGRGNSSPFLKGKQRFFQTSVTKQLPHSHKCTEAKNDWFGGLH